MEAALSGSGLDYRIPTTKEISLPTGDLVFLILDYAPASDDVRKASFGFSLVFRDDGTVGWERKCWISVPNERIQKIREDAPRFYSAYKEFCAYETRFFPYSVNLQSFGEFSLSAITEICNSLHAHIVWSS